MANLLRIDASVRIDGSHSRVLADHFETLWKAAHTEGRICRRDLAASPPPPLSQQVVDAFFGAQPQLATVSEELLEELAEADHLLISTPVYNFGMPSTLKAYFDQIVRSGRAFESCGGRYHGLLTRLRATILLTCGSPTTGDADEVCRQLRRILSFMGIGEIDVIVQSGTARDGSHVARKSELARREIDALFDTYDRNLWQGEFSDEDRTQINALRRGHAEAILHGDASAYAALCTEDVQLMIPGHPLTAGRMNLLELEQRLFAEVEFQSFRKLPVRVQRGGDLAIESGRQEVCVAGVSPERGVSSAHQKYSHVYRCTESGWRIWQLMSNDGGCDEQ